MASKCDEITRSLQELFEKDYKEFVRDRRRWKSDFDQASTKAQNNFNSIQGALYNCIRQNELNTAALKLVVEA